MGKCIFCNPMEFFGKDSVNRVLFSNEVFYVAIPREPAMKGHLLVVSKDHIEDISEVKEGSLMVLCEMILACATLSRNLKEWDHSIRKVYVLTQGETPHLHFHLKPRREGEEIGDLFLFEKELQESRWATQCDNESEARTSCVNNGLDKIAKGIALAKKHRTLMDQNMWLKSRDVAENLYQTMIKELKNIVEKSMSEMKEKIENMRGVGSYYCVGRR